MGLGLGRLQIRASSLRASFAIVVAWARCDSPRGALWQGCHHLNDLTLTSIFRALVFVRIEQDTKHRPVEPFVSSSAFPANRARGALLLEAKYHVFAYKIASLH